MYNMLIHLILNNQPIKRKKEGEEKRMSQEEMLLEAAQTGTVVISMLEMMCHGLLLTLYL